MLLSFLIDGDGSLVRVSPVREPKGGASPRLPGFEITSLSLDLEVAYRDGRAQGGRSAVFRACVANRTAATHAGVFTATLRDANGTPLAGRALRDGWRLAPGAIAHLAFGFALPECFVPYELVLEPIRVRLA